MQRRHDLDWVRVFAFALLVLYHVGMYYVSWDWHVKSPFANDTLEPLMLLSSPWRLSLLFFISGVATAFLLGKGQPGFVGARTRRLLIPLLFGMLVVVTPQAYYEVVDKLPGGYHDGYLAFWTRYLQADSSFCRDGDCLILPTWNHLWFVAYLWVYTLVLWALLRLFPAALGKAGSWLGRVMAGPGVLLLPVLWLAAARMLLLAHFESTHALVDDWYNHAQYFVVFLLGVLVARAEGVWEAMRRSRWLALPLALACWAGLVAYFSVWGEATPPEWQRQAMRAVWALLQWGAIVAVLGFARQWAPGDSPLLRTLSEAVFPVYILHQTLIVVIAVQLRPLGLTPLVEGPLLVVLTFAGCWLGVLLIRRSNLLRPLFGLRRLPPADGRPAAAAATP
jgi:glucans biosynthesis protein C